MQDEQDFFDKYRYLIAVVFVAIALGGVYIISLQGQHDPVLVITPYPTPTIAITPTVTPTPTPSPLRVYISGEVLHPDVYSLPPGSIIKDAIKAAGGASPEADLDVVNQAQELSDQEHVHIPAKSDKVPTPPVIEEGKRNIVIPIDKTPTPLVLDLNTATKPQLELLSGIGPATAQKILDYRAEIGHFNAIEDLMNVSGIGPATFEKLKDHITVE